MESSGFMAWWLHFMAHHILFLWADDRRLLIGRLWPFTTLKAPRRWTVLLGDNISEHHQTSGNVIACPVSLSQFHVRIHGQEWQEDDSLQTYHPLFHICPYWRTFSALKWVHIQLGLSENQLLLLMVFKCSHLGCCPVSLNKSCFCALWSHPYFPRIQKQWVFCRLTEQICCIEFSAR